ncbi:SDR family NAD(P)-dependent oxidoreductase [Paraburkholderia youngii]|uniref:SDR family NAD(P)-dependent oxidoreductase n=1 Tax=Paraburkholderia youngii TaxID=2782701 RepID=UPI003D2128EB
MAAARSLRGDSQAIRLDVTDQSSIIAATRQIENTWGPANEMRDGDKVSRATVDDIRLVFETNVFGVVAVMQAMLPLLRKAPAARIVNVSSAGGSLTLKDGPSDYSRQYVGFYQTSKTALNAITQAFAIELEGTGIKVNAVCPGFTALT